MGLFRVQPRALFEEGLNGSSDGENSSIDVFGGFRRQMARIQQGDEMNVENPLRTVCILVALFALSVAASPCEAKSKRAAGADLSGALVESVSPGLAADRAGLLTGDVILRWARPSASKNNGASLGPAAGSIRDPFDLDEAEWEQSPRGTVRLFALRKGQEIVLSLPPGGWGVTAVPRFPGAAAKESDQENTEKKSRGSFLRDRAIDASRHRNRRLSAWFFLQSARAFPEGEDAAAAGELVHSAATEADRSGDSRIISIVRRRAGKILEERHDLERAALEYRAGVAAREKLEEGPLLAELVGCLGRVLSAREEPEAAEAAFRRAVAIDERTCPESLQLASAFDRLGSHRQTRKDFDEARSSFRKAVALAERISPRGSEIVRYLTHLGTLLAMHGDLDEAETTYGRALAIEELREKGSPGVADLQNNLGNVAWIRGDPASAESLFRSALAIYEKLAPESLEVAYAIDNLGTTAFIRGEYAGAEALHRRALAIEEKLVPGSLDHAMTFNNLATVHIVRGELEEAESLLGRALAIKEKLDPESLDVAVTLTNLGAVAHGRGDFDKAETIQKRALAIREKLAPSGQELGECLDQLGQVAADRGDDAGAEDYFRRSLAIFHKAAPMSYAEAEMMSSLGEVLRRRGAGAESESLFRQGASISIRMAPGSLVEARAWHDLGLVYRETGRIGEASDSFCQAVFALDSQRGKLGGSDESRSSFGARYADYYRDYIDVLLVEHRGEEAFKVLERSRARALLAMLAERDLVFPDEVPPALERERKRLNAEYDKTFAHLGGLSFSTQTAEIEKADEMLTSIRNQQRDVTRRIRAASPRLAALRDPQPIGLAETRSMLDPGTLFVAYSIGREESWVFAVGPDRGDFEVARLDLTERSLRSDVDRFLALINRESQGRSTQKIEDNVHQLAESLSGRLLGPIAARVREASRLLISPDGPLHLLPFSAIAEPLVGEQGRRESKASKAPFRFLVEAKPIGLVVSATVEAELVKSRLTRISSRIAAFADPINSEGAAASFRGQGLLEPLPATRDEVAALRDLSPGELTAFLGVEATETQAKSLPRDTGIVHFACHALFDPQFPLDSSLVLSGPGAVTRESEITSAGPVDNGLLQAWEIMEGMRIEAELVTLSACETARGREVGGEGLIGLTRAFQFAGARAVLASLWSVADKSTAELMKRFYRELFSGQSKDESLRRAQLALLRGEAGESVSTPYHWAAFELFGDAK